MSDLSVTEMNVVVKESVLSALFEDGLNAVETVQTDSYKWVIPVEVDGEQRYAEVTLTAKKADYDESNLTEEAEKYAEKVAKAKNREADRLAKKTSKNSKLE
jgi:hypothetical protein